LEETHFKHIEHNATDLETGNLLPNHEHWRAAYRRITWPKP